jgi:peroxiredoxin
MKLVLVLLTALLLAGCSTGSDAVDVNNGGEFRFVAGTPAGEVIPAADRRSAPDFSGTLLGGGPFSSTSLDGQVAVINFWGSWCAPCRVETPEFQEVYAEVRDRGVAFLGVNVKEADEQFAQGFVDRFGIEFPSLYDPSGETALAFRDYPANAIPSTIVLDRSGRVAAVYTGAVAQDDLRAVLDRLTGEGGDDG